MESLIHNGIETLEQFVQNSSPLVSIAIGMSIIILESMIPMLPLALFIAINLLVFGNIIGFFLSWSATIIGCSLSFFLCKQLKKKIPNPKWLQTINHLPFSYLVLILSIPFTPAFSINIGAGLSDMKYTKYLFALFISKMFLIYFWGFIGATFLESITDVGILCKLASMILIAFILSKIVIHKLNMQ